MRRRIGICAVVLAVVAIAGLCAVWYSNYPTRPAITPHTKTPLVQRINELHVQEIQEGMTLAEVETPLGSPPGDYRTRPAKVIDSIASSAWHDESWTSDETHVRVAFNRDGRVMSVRPGFVLRQE
jgi:hypothetical protein